MKRVGSLLVLAAWGSAGCVTLPSWWSKPPGSPNSEPQIVFNVDSKLRSNLDSQQVKPEQVTEANAHASAKALDEELEQNAAKTGPATKAEPSK